MSSWETGREIRQRIGYYSANTTSPDQVTSVRGLSASIRLSDLMSLHFLQVTNTLAGDVSLRNIPPKALHMLFVGRSVFVYFANQIIINHEIST